MVGKAKSRTKADELRFEMIREIGCICCAIDGWAGVACQVQHELESTSRFEDEHRHTTGICPYHHTGQVPPPCRGSKELARERHGPNLRDESKAFQERYGTTEQRLQIQDRIIAIVKAGRRRGEYLQDREIAKLVRLLWQEIVNGESPDPKDVKKIGERA